jgi:hypothetical protein
LKEFAVLEGNKGVISALAFSPDGNYLAAGDVGYFFFFHLRLVPVVNLPSSSYSPRAKSCCLMSKKERSCSSIQLCSVTHSSLFFRPQRQSPLDGLSILPESIHFPGLPTPSTALPDRSIRMYTSGVSPNQRRTSLSRRLGQVV